jgi:hypothetical protein
MAWKQIQATEGQNLKEKEIKKKTEQRELNWNDMSSAQKKVTDIWNKNNKSAKKSKPTNVINTWICKHTTKSPVLAGLASRTGLRACGPACVEETFFYIICKNEVKYAMLGLDAQKNSSRTFRASAWIHSHSLSFQYHTQPCQYITSFGPCPSSSPN